MQAMCGIAAHRQTSRFGWLGKGLFHTPLHPQTEGAFVLPVEPMTRGFALWPDDHGPSCPLEPRPGNLSPETTSTLLERPRGCPPGPPAPGECAGGEGMAGSSKRQRTAQIVVRCTQDEFTAISDKADRAGLASAAFLRAAGLGSAGPRARRRLPADHQALRAILGQIGRIGGNINQIAKQLNAGDKLRIPELRDALNAYLDIRNAIFTALGMNTTPGEAPDDHQGNQSRKP